jgi:hypothetical protein
MIAMDTHSTYRSVDLMISKFLLNKTLLLVLDLMEMLIIPLSLLLKIQQSLEMEDTLSFPIGYTREFQYKMKEFS